MDGGSEDGTAELLTRWGIPIVRQRARGYNAAYMEAFDHCQCDALVVFPPKGNIDPLAILKVQDALLSGADLVIASRLVAGARNEDDEKLWKPRKWFVQALSLVASFLWNSNGYRVRDVLHGFRGMQCVSFRKINPRPEGLTVDLEMVVSAYQNGLIRIEVPVQEYPRLEGATHFKALPTGWKMVKYIAKRLLRPEASVSEPANPASSQL